MTKGRGKQPQPEPEVVAAKKTKETKSKEPEHRVQILTDHVLEYPDLYLKVHIAGPPAIEAAFAEMFARASCYFDSNPLESDLVVFTGGPDVCPSLYGLEEKNHHSKTYFNKARDNQDMQLYSDCIMNRIPMLGVCRGAQFLHVMNGGKLYQHVDNHTGDHPMFCTRTKNLVQKVSSTHHQMVMLNTSQTNPMEVLGIAHKSRKRYRTPLDYDEGQHQDIEAYFYPLHCCLGVQGHPEFRNYPMFTRWVLQQIEHWIVHSPRVKLENHLYRVQKSLILSDDSDEKGDVF